MPKSSHVSLFQEQKRFKPTVDELVQSIQDGELQHRMEAFVSFLKDCKLESKLVRDEFFQLQL